MKSSPFGYDDDAGQPLFDSITPARPPCDIPSPQELRSQIATGSCTIAVADKCNRVIWFFGFLQRPDEEAETGTTMEGALIHVQEVHGSKYMSLLHWNMCLRLSREMLSPARLRVVVVLCRPKLTFRGGAGGDQGCATH